MTDKPNKPRKQTGRVHRRKGLWITLGVLGVLAVGGVAALGVAYERLQPVHHFYDPPVVSVVSTKVTTQTTNPLKQPTVPQKPDTLNVLLLGSDERVGDDAGHSDSMIIVHVDLTHNTYSMLSIPRDTRVYLDGYGYTKLTSVMYVLQANHGVTAGTKAAVDAITNLTGLPINYYAETNYWGLQDIVDSVGGIQMKIPFPVTLTHAWFKQDDGKHFDAGTYALNGQMVTEVVHERYSLPNGDYGRQQLQEEALIGIAKKVMDPSNITKLPTVIREMPKYLITSNMHPADMLSLALAVKHFNSSQIHYYQANGSEQSMYNDILQANDDEIVLNMSELHQIVKEHFE